MAPASRSWFAVLACLLLSVASPAFTAERPNVVLVLFDDLGFGQPPGYDAASTFSMPAFEQFSHEGMRFTDAHAAAAVCTPTRYGVLTGRYPARIGQFGVLTTFSKPIIPKSRTTVAAYLQQQGYTTACVGKWHLGLSWEGGKPGSENRVPIGSRLTAGPNDLGFDYFCGFTHARNIGTIIEQDRVIEQVEPVENQPLMLEKALTWLDGRRSADQPFFLYFPMCPPHTPVVPAPEFIGQSGAEDLVGMDPRYGDWILQGDAMLGRLLDKLDELGVADNTLVIVTSDNGAEGREYPPLRKSKRSIYEGGHRVPFVARWPGHVAAGSTCDATVCLNDLFATMADILDAPPPANAAEDSVTMLPLLLGEQSTPVRESTWHQSMQGDIALRSGEWKLIIQKSGARELYNLRDDLSEKSDRASTDTATAARLFDVLAREAEQGRSTTGLQQPREYAFPQLKAAAR
ncbi:MAG: arylsulfatase [Planctomycetaceae bacterium]